MLPRVCGACFAPGGACADLSALLPVSPGSRAACEHDPRRVPGACGRSRVLTARRGLWSCRKAERAARVEPTEGRPKGKPACGRSLGPGRPGEPDHKAQPVVWRCRPPQARRARSRRRRPRPGVAGAGRCIPPCSSMHFKTQSAGRRAADCVETGGVLRCQCKPEGRAAEGVALPISPGRSELASEALDGCRALAVGPSD